MGGTRSSVEIGNSVGMLPEEWLLATLTFKAQSVAIKVDCDPRVRSRRGESPICLRRTPNDDKTFVSILFTRSGQTRK